MGSVNRFSGTEEAQAKWSIWGLHANAGCRLLIVLIGAFQRERITPIAEQRGYGVAAKFSDPPSDQLLPALTINRPGAIKTSTQNLRSRIELDLSSRPQNWTVRNGSPQT